MATNFLGSDNTITSTGGYYNGARNIVGDGNDLSAGGPGSNLNVVLNGGGSGNTISAGATGVPGNLNAGFNFFGGTNTVAAGPGPLALAGSIFRNGLAITQTGPGIAINDNPFGGAAATSGQSSTVSNTPARTRLLATGKKFAPTTFAAGSFNRAGSQPSGSLTKAGEQFSTSLNSLSKTVSDTVGKVTGALAGDAK